RAQRPARLPRRSAASGLSDQRRTHFQSRLALFPYTVEWLSTPAGSPYWLLGEGDTESMAPAGPGECRQTTPPDRLRHRPRVVPAVRPTVARVCLARSRAAYGRRSARDLPPLGVAKRADGF